MSSRAMEIFRKERFAVIARRIPENALIPASESLYEVGVRVLELTFDPSDPETLSNTARMIRAVRKALPDMAVGCGTVLTEEMLKTAAGAGAEFAVSPVTNARIIEAAHREGIAAIPGAYTPNEVLQAYEAGADLVKIFPVLPGQENYVKVIMSPLSHIPFIVTGGVTPETVDAMLGTGAVAVAAGASVLRSDLAAAGDFKAIADLARKHLEVIHG